MGVVRKWEGRKDTGLDNPFWKCISHNSGMIARTRGEGGYVSRAIRNAIRFLGDFCRVIELFIFSVRMWILARNPIPLSLAFRCTLVFPCWVVHAPRSNLASQRKVADLNVALQRQNFILGTLWWPRYRLICDTEIYYWRSRNVYFKAFSPEPDVRVLFLGPLH